MGLVGERNENLFCCRIGEMAGFSMLLSHPRGFLASLGFSSLTICLHEMIRRICSTKWAPSRGEWTKLHHKKVCCQYCGVVRCRAANQVADTSPSVCSLT